MSEQYWFNTTYACGLIETDDKGIVTFTAPIYKRWKGMHIDKVKFYLRKRIIQVVNLKTV